MKYSWVCSKCKKMRTLEMTVEEYDNLAEVVCEKDQHVATMNRVYIPAQLKFVGHGFTGAGGNQPHMDKQDRKKDLASASDAEPI